MQPVERTGPSSQIEALGAVEGSLDRELERARVENAKKSAEDERPPDVAADAVTEGHPADDTNADWDGDEGTDRETERETETE